MRHSFLVLSLLFFFGQIALAQTDTAYHRAVYKEVNDHLGEYSASDELKVKRPGDATPYKAKAWWQAHTMRKLVVTEKRGDYTRTTEFYYNTDGILTFAFIVDSENGVRTETRLYFSKNGNKLVKWLAGKEEIPKASHHFDDFGEATITASRELQEAIGE